MSLSLVFGNQSFYLVLWLATIFSSVVGGQRMHSFEQELPSDSRTDYIVISIGKDAGIWADEFIEYQKESSGRIFKPIIVERNEVFVQHNQVDDDNPREKDKNIEQNQATDSLRIAKKHHGVYIEDYLDAVDDVKTVKRQQWRSINANDYPALLLFENFTKPTDYVVLKMDIGGSEYEILRDLYLRGYLCNNVHKLFAKMHAMSHRMLYNLRNLDVALPWLLKPCDTDVYVSHDYFVGKKRYAKPSFSAESNPEFLDWPQGDDDCRVCPTLYRPMEEVQPRSWCPITAKKEPIVLSEKRKGFYDGRNGVYDDASNEAFYCFVDDSSPEALEQTKWRTCETCCDLTESLSGNPSCWDSSSNLRNYNFCCVGMVPEGIIFPKISRTGVEWNKKYWKVDIKRTDGGKTDVDGTTITLSKKKHLPFDIRHPHGPVPKDVGFYASDGVWYDLKNYTVKGMLGGETAQRPTKSPRSNEAGTNSLATSPQVRLPTIPTMYGEWTPEILTNFDGNRCDDPAARASRSATRENIRSPFTLINLGGVEWSNEMLLSFKAWKGIIGKFIAVEANPSEFFSEHFNTQRRVEKWCNSIAYLAAAGIKNGYVNFHVPTKGADWVQKYSNSTASLPTHGSLVGKSEIADTVKVMKIPQISTAQLLKNHTLPGDYVILRFDIEGAEYEVLRDLLLRNLLCGRVRKLYIEYHAIMHKSMASRRVMDGLLRWLLEPCGVEVQSYNLYFVGRYRMDGDWPKGDGSCAECGALYRPFESLQKFDWRRERGKAYIESGRTNIDFKTEEGIKSTIAGVLKTNTIGNRIVHSNPFTREDSIRPATCPPTASIASMRDGDTSAMTMGYLSCFGESKTDVQVAASNPDNGSGNRNTGSNPGDNYIYQDADLRLRKRCSHCCDTSVNLAGNCWNGDVGDGDVDLGHWQQLLPTEYQLLVGRKRDPEWYERSARKRFKTRWFNGFDTEEFKQQFDPDNGFKPAVWEDSDSESGVQGEPQSKGPSWNPVVQDMLQSAMKNGIQKDPHNGPNISLDIVVDSGPLDIVVDNGPNISLAVGPSDYVLVAATDEVRAQEIFKFCCLGIMPAKVLQIASTSGEPQGLPASRKMPLPYHLPPESNMLFQHGNSRMLLKHGKIFGQNVTYFGRTL